MFDLIDLSDIERVNLEKWRIVRNAKRANALRSKGADVRWSPFYNAWICK